VKDIGLDLFVSRFVQFLGLDKHGGKRKEGRIKGKRGNSL